MAAPNEQPIGPMGSGLLAPGSLRIPGPEPAPLPEPIDVELTIEGPDGQGVIDPATGAAQFELDDGGVLIDFNPEMPGRDAGGATKHAANLAEYISGDELNRIAEDTLRGVEQDIQSRQKWIDTRAQGIRLLGLDIEDPQSAGADASTAVAGQSTVRNPLMLEATLRFQANALGELLPSEGPVKVSDTTDETGADDEQAKALEDDLNYYLTNVATEYYEDTDRMLFYVGFGGCGFKKVYFCPIRQRPVSESVDAADIIVSNAITDLRNSGRLTHRIFMRQPMLRRMQLAGAYRDVVLSAPNPSEIDPVKQQIAESQGIDTQNQLPEDREHTIYEVYCELDIKGFEHKDRGKLTGLALPYRVAIDKDSRQVLEVRRNWAEDDERQLAKVPLVKYPFVRGLGFYDIGFVHILGNTTNALTAAWRETLDSGMFANFPGFLYAKGLGRQNTNEFRVAPGGGVGIDVSSVQGGDLRAAVMPLPYKTPDTGFVAFVKDVEETGRRLGGTAETNIGEGVQNAPVGTTLALIDQATKLESAVHKRLHGAQSEELQLLKQCFRENPASFITAVKRKGSHTWDETNFLAALDNASIVPKADPNTPSHMHRLMKAMGVKQIAQGDPSRYNMDEVDKYVMQQAGVADPDRFFAKTASAPPPDSKLIELQIKGQQQTEKLAAESNDNAVKLKMQQNESADQAAERASRERIADTHLQETLIDHAANGVAPSVQ